MSSALVELVIAVAATWQSVEIWRHSYIMATFRAKADLLDNWFGYLLKCPFCLSVSVGVIVSCVVFAPVPTYTDNIYLWPFVLIGIGVKLFVTGLAVSRLANLGNDLAYAYCRTPKEDRVDWTPVVDNASESHADPDVLPFDERKYGPTDDPKPDNI